MKRCYTRADKNQMKDSNKVKEKGNNKRNRAGLALLLVLLLAAFFFISSDAPFIKGARDSLMQRLGYEAIEDTEGGGDGSSSGQNGGTQTVDGADLAALDASALPEYNGEHYVKVNGGRPEFPDEAYERAGLVKDGDTWKTNGNLLGTVDSNKLTPYEYYGSLDNLDRCTYAYGCLG